MTAITTQHASVAWIALDAAERFGPRPALTSPRSDPITYAQLGTAVREIAGGLAALGIERGDHVAILAGTRPEWTLADLGDPGRRRHGRPDLPRRTRPRSASTCSRTPESARSSARTPSRSRRSSRSASAARRSSTSSCSRARRRARCTLAELRRMGAASGEMPSWSAGSPASAPSDVATIVYTSGTTGPPKGCVTHAREPARHRGRHVRARARARRRAIVDLPVPPARALARARRAGRRAEAGGTLAFWGGDAKQIVDELAEVRADALPLGAAHLREDPHGGAERRRRAEPRQAGAVPLGARGRAPDGGPPARGRDARPPRPRRHGVADRLVLSKVRAVFGDRLAAGACAAPRRSAARCSSSSTPAACSCSRATA